MKEIALADCWYWFLLAAVVSYFLGCINFAVIISKARHRDVRKIGSGNPGSMNMSREFGLKVGLLNFLFDCLKGGIAVIAVYYIFEGYRFEGTKILVSDMARYVAGLFAVIGHIYPVFLKFKGGKGIATTYGVFWFGIGCEDPWYFMFVLVAFILVLLFILITEMGSMGSLLGVTAFSIWQGSIFYDRYVGVMKISMGYVAVLFTLLLLLNFLTWFRHRENLIRLFAGEEHRTSVKKLHGGKRGMDNM
ncbi:MAG: glycerol-3-phosphate acyltransferase [Clostridia bacterium]|nr:glycerol-3-phosphate acyltransferase [Clostridia bacterium]